MSKYRKKPVVIEARQLGNDYDEDIAIMRWCHGEPCAHDETCCLFRIQTMEGSLFACGGDWIIKGVKGEFYPCKPDIFEATYERVEPVIEVERIPVSDDQSQAITEAFHQGKDL
jgi:hypothetical protein